MIEAGLDKYLGMSFGVGSFLEATVGARNDANKRFYSEISSDYSIPNVSTMAQPCLAPLPPPSRPNMNMNIYSSTPKLSLTLPSNLEASQGEMFRCSSGEFQHQQQQGRSKDEDYESRSGSDNMDGNGSGDDQDDNQPRKKRYHRHTPRQIQEMEALFKECPHPDEKQRQLLSKQLGLAPRQIKFWFQNRRTQMKAQQERHENNLLRQENEKLRMENLRIRDLMRNPACGTCGGPAVITEMCLEEQHLRIENARLKEELDRLYGIAGKFSGRSISSLASLPMMHSSSLDLAIGAGVVPGGSCFDGLHPTMDPTAELRHLPPAVSDVSSRTVGSMGIDRSLIAELAIAAMDELVKMAQMQEPLWTRSIEDGKEALSYEEYLRLFPRGLGIGITHKTEATRQAGTVIMDCLNLVETLMDANRCMEMFPCIISKAATFEVMSSGAGTTRHGALQLMFMEMQFPSPMVPTREVHFLRFCQQQCEGVWAVVDVSVDCLRENSPALLTKCRRRPSGCLIQDLDTGGCQVTWVEHADYGDVDVQGSLFRTLINSGMAFGAGRWLTTLQRQCERLAVLMVSNMPTSGIASSIGRRGVMKLAQRMTNSFCAAVSSPTSQNWTRLSNATDDIRITTRKNTDANGEHNPAVLSAATSVWLPVSPQRLFDFLRDPSLRTKWDILSNGCQRHEVAHIAKGRDPGNSISLLGTTGLNPNENNVLILQECCTDSFGSFVVYAPVDVSAIQLVMSGCDSTPVALLPSGFAVLPEGYQYRSLAAYEAGKNLNSLQIGGSLLTVSFQIWADSLPPCNQTSDSVDTINNLISHTVKKIKAALGVENEYD